MIHKCLRAAALQEAFLATEVENHEHSPHITRAKRSVPLCWGNEGLWEASARLMTMCGTVKEEARTDRQLRGRGLPVAINALTHLASAPKETTLWPWRTKSGLFNCGNFSLMCITLLHFSHCLEWKAGLQADNLKASIGLCKCLRCPTGFGVRYFMGFWMQQVAD